MPNLITTIDLAAPPEAVWTVLADFPGWRRWNPIMTDMRGHAVPGTRVRFRIRLGGGPPLPIRVRMLRVEPQRELRWLGGVRGILLGERYFLIRPQGRGTRLVHGERFSGVLSRICTRGGLAARIEAAYEATNRALQSVLEGRSPGRASAAPRAFRK